MKLTDVLLKINIIMNILTIWNVLLILLTHGRYYQSKYDVTDKFLECVSKIDKEGCKKNLFYYRKTNLLNNLNTLL